MTKIVWYIKFVLFAKLELNEDCERSEGVSISKSHFGFVQNIGTNLAAW
jgi:hypothetical protein